MLNYNLRAKEEKKEEKPDMADFETFVENFDKIEKQHRKAGKAMVKGVRFKVMSYLEGNAFHSGQRFEEKFETT